MGLSPHKRTLLIVGGSLGARTLNESVLGNLPLVRQQNDIQFIWQTGGYYKEEIKAELARRASPTTCM